MPREAAERGGTQEPIQSDIVQDITAAIEDSKTLIGEQKERLLEELKPFFDRFNQYVTLHEDFVTDVGEVTEENESHREVVEEVFRRVLGRRTDDLTAMEDRELEWVIADFGQCAVSRKVEGLVTDLEGKTAELKVG